MFYIEFHLSRQVLI